MNDGVTLWDRDRLYIAASTNSDGSVTITGDDANAFGIGMNYEYWIVIHKEGIPKLIAALNGKPSDDPLTLLKENAHKVAPGVRSWLEEQRIPASFRGR